MAAVPVPARVRFGAIVEDGAKYKIIEPNGVECGDAHLFAQWVLLNNLSEVKEMRNPCVV